jgi:hypothetical protein
MNSTFSTHQIPTALESVSQMSGLFEVSLSGILPGISSVELDFLR